MRKALAKNLRNVNGKLVPGSKHPINYYVITDPELKKKNDAMADGVFDIDKNEFVRRPEEETFDLVTVSQLNGVVQRHVEQS